MSDNNHMAKYGNRTIVVVGNNKIYAMYKGAAERVGKLEENEGKFLYFLWMAEYEQYMLIEVSNEANYTSLQKVASYYFEGHIVNDNGQLYPVRQQGNKILMVIGAEEKEIGHITASLNSPFEVHLWIKDTEGELKHITTSHLSKVEYNIRQIAAAYIVAELN